jgi:hypothetical protein
MKAKYLGPGDAVELDGLRFERGETIEITSEQLTRIRASDAHAAVEVVKAEPETPLVLARIGADQDKARTQGALEREKREQDELDERNRLANEAGERATKAAAERQKLAEDREQARREGVAAQAQGGKKK